MVREKEINPVALVPWEYVPDDVVDMIENSLRIWCDNVEIWFDRNKMSQGINVPMQEDQLEVLAWHEMNSLGLLGAINIKLLHSRNAQISLDWQTGSSPGILVAQLPMTIMPSYTDATIQHLKKYGYQVEGLTDGNA